MICHSSKLTRDIPVLKCVEKQIFLRTSGKPLENNPYESESISHVLQAKKPEKLLGIVKSGSSQVVSGKLL